MQEVSEGEFFFCVEVGVCVSFSEMQRQLACCDICLQNQKDQVGREVSARRGLRDWMAAAFNVT